MKIFVTGGTGFIGRRVVKRLRCSGHDLRCLARKTSDLGPLRDAGAEVVIGDVTDAASVARAAEGCGWVVNLANLFELWVRDRRQYRAVNVAGTRNVMKAALAAGADKVVHVSTVTVYGQTAWPIREDSPLGTRCATEYARSKREGDAVAWALYREEGLPLVVVMPGGVLGAGDPKAGGRFVEGVAHHRAPARICTRHPFAWVHVDDVALAIDRALEKPGNIGQAYMIVGESMTFSEFYRLISEVSGVPLPILALPDWLATAGAHACTVLASLTGKPPLLDLSVDQVALMRQGFIADGGKAARELGLAYTPIRRALEDEIGPPASRGVPGR